MARPAGVGRMPSSERNHVVWQLTSQDAVPKGGGEAKEQDGQQPFEW